MLNLVPFYLFNPDLIGGCVCFLPGTYTELVEHHKHTKKPSNSGAISALWYLSVLYEMHTLPTHTTYENLA